MKVLLATMIIVSWGVVGAQERLIGSFGGLGVRAMGMGGAYTAIAEDFTATFWNPAGLAQITKRQVCAAFLRNTYDTELLCAGLDIRTV